MLHQWRRRVEEEKGFTLIELLVVILIIGILAGIAIPAFLSQRTKAYDASAKANVQTAEQAEEAYAADNNGLYTLTINTANAADALVKIEPTLHNPPYVTGSGTGVSSYTLSSTASGVNVDTFTITAVNGVVTRSCSGTGGGCTNSTW
jgi:type IV pilus assembly protein PilA